MNLPHHRDFRFRKQAFWAMSLMGISGAAWTSALSAGQFLLAVVIIPVMAVFSYFLTWVVVRGDARFRDVHPRKIRLTSLFTFYVPVVLSIVLLLGSPWIPQIVGLKASMDHVMYFLMVPCLMSSSAGAYRAFE